MALSKTKISFDLFDEKSIENAVNKLNVFKTRHDNRVDLFIQKLAEHGVEIAQLKIIDYPAVFTGELFDSIHVEPREGNGFAIISDSEHTAFVEFGTGQWGANKPYPYELPEGVTWDYNVGKHIQYAEKDLWWGDRKIPQGSYYWFYFKNGRWWISQGFESRPFMYETYLDLNTKKMIRQVAREVFKDA